MKKATCTWGDGPDVILSFEDDMLVLYEDPKHQLPGHGDYIYGYVTKGSTDLTADEALKLAGQLTAAAENAKELDRICDDLDKLNTETRRRTLKHDMEHKQFMGEPLSEEMKAINADHSLEILTCYKCDQRGECKYVDDLYNTNGDCLAMK